MRFLRCLEYTETGLHWCATGAMQLRELTCWMRYWDAPKCRRLGQGMKQGLRDFD